MDGLVSTGIQIPYTILKIIFSILKNNYNYFIHIFSGRVEKDRQKMETVEDEEMNRSSQTKNTIC